MSETEMTGTSARIQAGIDERASESQTVSVVIATAPDAAKNRPNEARPTVLVIAADIESPNPLAKEAGHPAHEAVCRRRRPRILHRPLDEPQGNGMLTRV